MGLDTNLSMYCSRAGKVCYTKKDAETKRNARSKGTYFEDVRSDRKRRVSRKGSRVLRIYPCKYCNHWHLAHATPCVRRHDKLALWRHEDLAPSMS